MLGAEPAKVLSIAPLPPVHMLRLDDTYGLIACELKRDSALPSAIDRMGIRILQTTGTRGAESALLKQLPNLEVVAVSGVGLDGVDVMLCQDRGITVLHTPGVMAEDVADLTLGLVLDFFRQLPVAYMFVQQGRWSSERFPLSRRPSGARLGLLGYGMVGRAIGRRARAFAMQVGAVDPALANRPEADIDRRFDDAAALAQWCDILVLCAPATPETHHIVGAAELENLGRDGLLINVGRGSLVDTQALMVALEAGHISGACLDVVENEPNVPKRLIDAPNVLLTPHIGSATIECRVEMASVLLDKIDKWYDHSLAMGTTWDNRTA
jgi:hydroxypyruvate reductase